MGSKKSHFPIKFVVALDGLKSLNRYIMPYPKNKITYKVLVQPGKSAKITIEYNVLHQYYLPSMVPKILYIGERVVGKGCRETMNSSRFCHGIVIISGLSPCFAVI